MFVSDLAIVAGLILLNGLLAMAELALVSARRPRLQAMAAAGNKNAEAALKLAEDPGRFLSTVQIGITLVGILVGAYSGATIAEKVADIFIARGMSDATAHTLAFVLIVGAITYLSLIVGELVPKQLALRFAEPLACALVRPMKILSLAATPLVFLLDTSSRLVLRVLVGNEKRKSDVTDEEIKSLVLEAESAGVVETAEREMISGVMRLADQPVRTLMTARTDVDWLDIEAEKADVLRQLRASNHSRLPVGKGSIDEPVGILIAKAVLDAFIDNADADPRQFVIPAPIVPDTADAIQAMEVLKSSAAHMALVVDEYGTFEGVVTATDMLDAIAGGFAPADPGQLEAVQRDDGSWLFDGLMPVDEMVDMLGIARPSDKSFATVGGFMLNQLRRMPRAGDHFTYGTWKFEVVDMDGKRVDKVLAQRLDLGEDDELDV
jgi:putative hemolysin